MVKVASKVMKLHSVGMKSLLNLEMLQDKIILEVVIILDKVVNKI